MTIQGAVYELKRMMLRDDIPDYIKPTIKKVIETVVDEYNEILKNEIVKVLNEIKAKITNAQYESAFPLDIEHANSIIDGKIKELQNDE